MTIPIPDLNLNVNQTAIAEISGDLSVTTGAFFSGRSQPEMQGPQNLLNGSIKSDGVGGVLMIVGAGLLIFALLRKGK